MKTLACAVAGLALALAGSARAGEPRELTGTRSISETRPVDPNASIEIVNVAGSVTVQGWSEPKLEVTGTIGGKVERVDVSSSGAHASVRVVLPNGPQWGGDGSADLVVRVPSRSSVSASLVSADLEVADLQGDAHLRTVSGNVSGSLDGDAHVNTVSGDVRLTARNAKYLEVKTISGDVNVFGAGGDVDVATVSGDAELSLGALTRGRFETVSGDFGVGSTLAAGGQIDGESVSGDFSLSFPAPPNAAIDIRSFSGEIENCFGQKAVSAEYGPGARLQYTSGDGNGRVRLDTKSGNVSLCAKPPRPPGGPRGPRPPPAPPPPGG